MKKRRLQTQGEGPRTVALEAQMNLTHGLTPKRLRSILELADQGDIVEQHTLFADMEDRCEHLAAEMGKRKRALLTLDWEILPGRAKDARGRGDCGGGQGTGGRPRRLRGFADGHGGRHRARLLRL